VNANAQQELYSIKQELNSIISELEDIEWGVRHDFKNIGNNICADRIKATLNDKLYKARNALRNMDTSKVSEQFSGGR
jgi:hypothetical protein